MEMTESPRFALTACLMVSALVPVSYTHLHVQGKGKADLSSWHGVSVVGDFCQPVVFVFDHVRQTSSLCSSGYRSFTAISCNKTTSIGEGVDRKTAVIGTSITGNGLGTMTKISKSLFVEQGAFSGSMCFCIECGSKCSHKSGDLWTNDISA